MLNLRVSQRQDHISDDLSSFEFRGSCMTVHLVDFSVLRHETSSKGLRRLDELREIMSGYFGHIIKKVYEFNGDGKSNIVIKILISR